jgi:kynurenine formamidase
MTTYPGLPGPVVCDFISREQSRARYAPGTEFQIGKVELVSNTGTYVDTPFHRYAGGDDLSRQPLWPLAGRPALVVRPEPEDGAAIGPEAFAGLDVHGRAVLVQTNWDRHWGSDEYLSGRHPYLTGPAAEALRDAGAALVGIDCLNIDSIADGERPVHTALLGAGIPIVEHMTGLAHVPDGARFYAVPPPIEGMGTFPVRAFAIAG